MPNDDPNAAGAAAAATTPAPAAAAPAGDPAAAAPKWYQAPEFGPEEQAWLTARGLAVDDPLQVLPKLVKGHRGAEVKLGKGLDSILDRPAKDQALKDWLRGNAGAIGLPDTEDAYEVKPPEFWPKDVSWNAEAEKAARKIAFDHGIPPEGHKAYVEMFAQIQKSYDDAARQGYAQDNAKMMDELRRDLGPDTDAAIVRASQAAQALAERAGVGADGITAMSQLLTDKLGGSALVIKIFNEVGKIIGDDQILGANSPGSAGAVTKADIQAQIDAFEGPEGEYGKAFAAGNTAQLAALRGRRDALYQRLTSARG